MAEQKRGAWRNGPMKSLLARPIAFHPALARICGSITAGLMLSQALYWSERTTDGSGWFYKKYDEWNEELYLSRHELDGARRVLRDKGFIREDKRGMPAKTYYFVEVDAVCEAIEQLSENKQSSQPKIGNQGCRKAADRESGKHDRRNPAGMDAEKQQPFLSETETTAESTTTTTVAQSPIGAVDVEKALSRYEPSVDGLAVARMIAECLKALPDITTEELVDAIHSKGVKLGKSVVSPLGVLLTVVPAWVGDASFSRRRVAVRKSIAAEAERVRRVVEFGEFERLSGAPAIEQWETMRESLRSLLNVHSFSIWIRAVRAVSFESGELVLVVPTAEFLGIEDRFKSEFATARALAGVRDVRVILPAAACDLLYGRATDDTGREGVRR